MDSQQQGILISASVLPFCGELEETTKTQQAVALCSLFQNVSVLDFPGERIPRNRDDNDIHKLQNTTPTTKARAERHTNKKSVS